MARPRRAIEADLKAAEEAKELLPELQKRIENEADVRGEMDRWEAGFAAERQAAINAATETVAQIREAQEDVARLVKEVARSPEWQLIEAMLNVNKLRLAFRACCKTVLRVEYERALRIRGEEGEPSMRSAQIEAVVQSSEGRIAQLMDELDPGYSPFRGVSAQHERLVRMGIFLLEPARYVTPQPVEGR